MNQVVAALGSARAIAIQTNSTVMVIFTVNVDPAQLGDGEIVEIVLAKASGEISTRYARQWYDERRASLGWADGERRKVRQRRAGGMVTVCEELEGGAVEAHLWHCMSRS